jgi:hypothetical protein
LTDALGFGLAGLVYPASDLVDAFQGTPPTFFFFF